MYCKNPHNLRKNVQIEELVLELDPYWGLFWSSVEIQKLDPINNQTKRAMPKELS